MAFWRSLRVYEPRADTERRVWEQEEGIRRSVIAWTYSGSWSLYGPHLCGGDLDAEPLDRRRLSLLAPSREKDIFGRSVRLHIMIRSIKSQIEINLATSGHVVGHAVPLTAGIHRSLSTYRQRTNTALRWRQKNRDLSSTRSDDRHRIKATISGISEEKDNPFVSVSVLR